MAVKLVEFLSGLNAMAFPTQLVTRMTVIFFSIKSRTTLLEHKLHIWCQSIACGSVLINNNELKKKTFHFVCIALIAA
jgi:hypothetical protein